MVDAIKDIIAKQLQIDAIMIDDDADIFDDLGADSLDVVEMLMAVEVNLGVSVPDDKIVNMKTVRDIKNYIEMII
jgi:acyl carrier protein